MSGREIIREAIIANVTRSPTTKTNAVLDALTAAGYRIIGPGEVDPVTVERCVNTIAKANERVASVEAPVMGGDNLAICLCSFFDDGDKETEDDTGWSVAARNGYEQTIEAIREHYATALRSLTEAKP